LSFSRILTIRSFLAFRAGPGIVTGSVEKNLEVEAVSFMAKRARLFRTAPLFAPRFVYDNVLLDHIPQRPNDTPATLHLGSGYGRFHRGDQARDGKVTGKLADGDPDRIPFASPRMGPAGLSTTATKTGLLFGEESRLRPILATHKRISRHLRWRKRRTTTRRIEITRSASRRMRRWAASLH